MIRKIYDKLAESHNEIKNQIYNIASYLRQEIQEKVNEFWTEYTRDNELSEICKFVAIDGGSFSKPMRIGIVYAVGAESVIGDNKGVKTLSEDGQIGIFKPGNDAQERISLLMETLELSLALRDGSKGDYILMDGSLNKKIGNKVDIQQISDEELKLVKNVDINSIISIKDERKMRDLLILLNQFLVSRIIEQYDGKVLWISKTSRGRDLFGTDYPDITVFELFTEKRGFSKLIIKNIDIRKISEIPELEILRKMEYTTFYTRLDNGKRVVRIDMVGRVDEKIVKEIMDHLSGVSIKGYPFPLLKAHIDVRFSRMDREKIIKLMGSKLHKDIEWWPSQFY
ncbi:5'-3' exonuclease [Sulfolobus islandicus]|uniref:NurA 5'-3' nuclease n=1 Tax=Saccharolobus islandicus (strain HVE10/4) TaxID=930943 RepID=F0NMQ5_SACI0|nr:DNA double-strand break repair nuclease NurA [Sulfolobus islandicus]ADX81434.1 NurA 5'-3' nuclease [Sulfolobus islandicus HVE10/4]WCM37178.1 5'-3' exonuclease [Sulfolobus islandicus]